VAGRGVPRIAFGTGSLPRAADTPARQIPRIAFGSKSTAPALVGGAGRAGAARSDGWVGQGPLDARISAAPRLRLALAPPRTTGPRLRTAPRFASGPWLAGAALAGAGFGRSAGLGGSPTVTGNRSYALSRPVRKVKRPRFARSAPRYQVARKRQPKTARFRPGRRSFRRLPWLRRAGDRSTVWRIGSRRTGGYR